MLSYFRKDDLQKKGRKAKSRAKSRAKSQRISNNQGKRRRSSQYLEPGTKEIYFDKELDLLEVNMLSTSKPVLRQHNDNVELCSAMRRAEALTSRRHASVRIRICIHAINFEMADVI